MAIVKASQPLCQQVPPEHPGDSLHKRLVWRGVRWLYSTHRCTLIMAEKGTTLNGELPDVIGWRLGAGAQSILVECKATRSDFLADRTKPHRADMAGMGQQRYFLTIPGIIKPLELPPGWGLIEWHEGRRPNLVIVHAAHPTQHLVAYHAEAERRMLISALLDLTRLVPLEAME